MKRQCGECTLCCRLLPVPQLGKVAGQRCPHQRHSCGCAIYNTRPNSCRLWSCRWKADPEETADLRRPDRSHYVIDMMPDYVVVTGPSGVPENVPVVQIWSDPRFPDAHRDPALRAYLEANQVPGIVRYGGNKEALILIPPCCSENKKWHEVVPAMTLPEHGAADIADKLGLELIAVNEQGINVLVDTTLGGNGAAKKGGSDD